MGTRPVPDRAIVLTFDDGRASLWTVGAPLLRRYGMTGIVFLIPGRTVSRPGPLPPTIDDAPRRRPPPAAATRACSPGSRSRRSPARARSSSRATPTPTRACTSGRAWSASSPRSRGAGTPALDLPMIHADGRDLMGEEVAPGTPILASEPRMGEARRFYEDPAIRDGGGARGGGRRRRRVLRPRGLARGPARDGAAARARPLGDRGREGGRHPPRARGVAARDRGAHGQAGDPPLPSVARRRARPRGG